MERSEFAGFVAARSSRLLRTAYLLTHDHHAAEDLLQTALAKSWSAWSRIDGDPEGYVRSVIVNTYVSWWRRRWRGEIPTGELPDRECAADVTLAVDERSALWQAIGALPRRQRAVVVLRYFEDLSEADTAALLGVSVGTVKSSASRALATLRVDPTLEAPTRTDQSGSAVSEGGVSRCR